jgi:hypothetical protein
MKNYTITNNGRALASCFGVGPFDLRPLGVLSVIVRHSKSLERLAVAECSGPDWENRKWMTQANQEKWELDLEAKREKLERRIFQLWGELVSLVPSLEGVTPELGGDPRGYVVRFAWPEGTGAIHYDSGTACGVHGASHCTGGKAGQCRAVGIA